MKSLYEYLYYCMYCVAGKNDSVYMRVSSILSVGTSFLLMSLFIFFKVLVLKQLNSSSENFIIIMSIFMGNLVLHWLYFLINRRYEGIIEKHETNGSKVREILTGISYLVFSFCFLIFTFYILGQSTSELIKTRQ
jgi:hypothetical protein